MFFRFATIHLIAFVNLVCGWEEFGLRVPMNEQNPRNRKRRVLSIWDERSKSREKFEGEDKEDVFDSILQYESITEGESLSISMSMPMPMPMIPSSEPTNDPLILSSPPTLIAPVFPTTNSPTASITAKPSDAPSRLFHFHPTTNHATQSNIPTTTDTERPSQTPSNLFHPTVNHVIQSEIPTDTPTSFQPGASLSQTPTMQSTATFSGPTPTTSVPLPRISQSPTIVEPTASPVLTSMKPTATRTPTLSVAPSGSSTPVLLSPGSSPVPTIPMSAVSQLPTVLPTLSRSPTASAKPSSSATPSSQPSVSATPTTTTAPTVSFNPTVVPTFVPSSLSQVVPTVAFDCVGNGIISLGEAKTENTTAITLFLGYQVQSTRNSTDDFLGDLEQYLLLTAVAAALGCDRSDLRRRLLMGTSRRKLFSKQSTIVDSVPCNTTVAGAVSCNTIETDLVFFLKGKVDPDRAAFSGYSAIRAKMINDEYIGIIPSVLNLVYKSPLPIPAPPQLQQDQVSKKNGDSERLVASERRLQVSPWTIGACVASVFGGIVSLLVWSRNRRSRHDRHMQLVEDCSIVESTSRNPVSV